MGNYATINIEPRGNSEDIEKFWMDVEKNYEVHNRKYLTYKMGYVRPELPIFKKLIVDYNLYFTFSYSTDMDYNQLVTVFEYDENHEMYAWTEAYEFGDDIVSIDDNGVKTVHVPYTLAEKTEKDNITESFMMDMKNEHYMDIYNYMFKQTRIKKLNSLF